MRREARAVSSIVPWRAVTCCYVKQTPKREGMPTVSPHLVNCPPWRHWQCVSACTSKSTPLAERRLNDPDENLSCNQYTSPLYLSQGRKLGIAKQQRYLAWQVAIFANPRGRKSIQEVRPAVIRKQFSIFLLNSEDLNKSMIEAEIISHVFRFSGLFLLMLSVLCDWRSPFHPLPNFTQGFLTCFPWTTLFLNHVYAMKIVWALRSNLDLYPDTSSY